MTNFCEKKVFVFDAFGTLFKAGKIDETLQDLADEQTESLLTLWRRKQLEYSWLRNQMQAYVPFHQVTKEALEFSMRVHQLEDERIVEKKAERPESWKKQTQLGRQQAESAQSMDWLGQKQKVQCHLVNEIHSLRAVSDRDVNHAEPW